MSGLIVAGTTGEAPTLNDEEFQEVIKTVVRSASGKLQIIAGTGSNSLDHTLHRTALAKEAGADAALVVTPYYNKPQQGALIKYFEAVAKKGGLPVIMYNVPSRTGVNMLPETVAAAAGIDGIIGIKEASGDVKQLRKTVIATGGMFPVLSGDDATVLPAFAVGAKGVISVVSNILPVDMMDMFEAYKRGDVKQAAGIDSRLVPVYEALFMETNPVPVKTAMYFMGLCSDEVRLPLQKASEHTRKVLKDVLRTFELI